MKTNQVLVSQDRELFGVKIEQRTDNSFLCLTTLLEAYTVARVKNNWNNKRIDHVYETEDFCERLYYMLKKINSVNTEFIEFREKYNQKGFPSYMKELGLYKVYGARENKKIWCDPYIFVMLSMELNPVLYAETIIWLTDSLIFNRIEAGINYLPFCDAIENKIKPNELDQGDWLYSNIAKHLNKCVFGRHEAGIRNSANKKELEIIKMTEITMTVLINSNIVDSYEKCKSMIESTILELTQNKLY
jgi:hypothetical protein